MKQTRFKYFLLVMAFTLLGYVYVHAQCTTGAQPTDFTTANPTIFSATGYTIHNYTPGDGHSEIVTINNSGGTTSKANLRLIIDAQGSIQIKFNAQNQFFSTDGGGYPNQDISNTYSNTNNTFAITATVGGTTRSYGATNSGVVTTGAGEYKLKSISDVVRTGAGTTASPYKWTFRIEYYAEVLNNLSSSYVATDDILITEINTYVDGDKFVRRDRQVTIGPAGTYKFYDARDAYFMGTSDGGYGMYSTAGLSYSLNGSDNIVDPSSNNLNFIGVTNSDYSSGKVILGLWEITPWVNWNVAAFNNQYTNINAGNNLNNMVVSSNNDIGYVAQYGTVTKTTSTATNYYYSVYDIISEPCPLILRPDFNAGFLNKPIPGNVATNDSYISGYEYKNIIAIGGNPSTAIPTLNADGTYTFQTSAAATSAGTYNFTYNVCPIGSTTGCSTGYLTITVGNDAVQTNNIAAAPDFAVLNQPSTGTTTATIDVLHNDRSLNDNKSLYISSFTQPVGGSTNGSVALVDGKLVYTPPSSTFTGNVEFSYEVCETVPTSAVCKTEKVYVTVYPSTQIATIVGADDLLIVEAGSTKTVTGNVATNDKSSNTIKNVNPETIVKAGVGTLDIKADGSYTFTPESGFSGTATFPYAINNGSGAGANATLVITAASVIPLPVVFNEFSAKIVNGQLIIDWSTLTEKNFDHFIVEVSNDGVNWKVLDKVSSKSLDGNSDKELKYSLTKSLSGTSSLFGVSFSSFGLLMMILLGIGLTISTTSRRKYASSVLSLLLAISIIGTATSCKKNSDSVFETAKSKIFVRITTVDKDGKTEVSKVIQAVQE